MDLQSFLRSKGYSAVAILGACLIAGLLYQANGKSVIATEDESSAPSTVVVSAGSQNTNDASIREIKDALSDMQEQVAGQLSKIERLSQQNMQDIAELKRQQTEPGNETIANVSNEISTEIDNVDPDYRQEQEAMGAEARQAAYVAIVDDYFTSQQEDVSWTAEVESEIRTAFQDYDSRLQLNNISCGDAMCKVQANVIEASDASNEPLPPFDQIIHGNAKWPGQSMYMMNLDTGEVTLYLMREGVGLPQEIDS